VFDVTIPGNGSLEALVEWESGSSTKTREVSSGEPRKFLEKDKTESIITEWGTSYLVLSNSSWTRPISSFSIQFVCHSSRFRDPLVGMTIVPTHEGVIGDHHIKGTVDRFRVSDDYTDQVQTAIGTDQNGDSTYTITIKDWHEGDSYIRCRGSSETDVIEKADTYFYIELGSLIGAIGLFLLFITVLIIRRKRKR
jgi:hypothetical protein